MTKEYKIKNAARYWNICKKEGFPKGQKKVFDEWLEKDVKNKETYEELYGTSSINAIENHPTTDKKENRFYFYLIFTTIVIIITLIIVKSQY